MKKKGVHKVYLMMSLMATFVSLFFPWGYSLSLIFSLCSCFCCWIIFSNRLKIASNSEIGELSVEPMVKLSFESIVRKTENDSKWVLQGYSRSLEEHNFRVLLVDDNKTIQLVVGNVLRQLGCQVDCALNGIEACRATQQKDYDVILMDWCMPRMDGATAAYKIRTVDSYNYETPIVALVTNEVNYSGYSDYFNSYMRKPLSKNSLEKMLDDLQKRQLLEQRY